MKVTWITSAHVKAPAWLLGPAWPFKSVWLPVRYGIVEHPDHITLIDAGYGPSLFQVKPSLPLAAYRRLLSIKLNPDADPACVLPKMGRRVEEVTDVVLSHLHADHVGYLASVPKARLHCHHAAFHARSLWREGYFPELLPADFERRVVCYTPGSHYRDTPLVPGLFGVDLPGHARGQMGIVIDTPRPVLYAADVAWSYDSLGYLAGPARLITAQPEVVKASAARVKTLEASGMEVVLCHTP